MIIMIDTTIVIMLYAFGILWGKDKYNLIISRCVSSFVTEGRFLLFAIKFIKNISHMGFVTVLLLL